MSVWVCVGVHECVCTHVCVCVSYFTSPLFKGVYVSQLVYRYECDCMMSLGFVTHVFIFLVPSAICLKCRASPYTSQLSSGYVFTDTVPNSSEVCFVVGTD